MLLKLLQGMDRSRFASSVLSLTNAGQIGPRIVDLGIDVEALGMRRGVPDPFGLLRLIRRIRSARPHVVQTWLYHADLLGLLAAPLAGNPSVAWNLRCSYMGEGFYRGATGLVIRTLARMSGMPAAVVYNSEAGRALHASLGYHPRRWVLIPNGFDTEQLRPNPEARLRIRAEMGIAADAPVVGMVARLDAVKGHDTFLAAATRLLQVQPRARFVLVGADCTESNPAMQGMIPPEVSDAVILLGERQDIADITASMDIATCASIGEGFPNVVGEAMACGVPSVVTDVGDCAKIVAETGRVVPPGDSNAMARAWNDILSLSTAARATLSAAARERVKRHYEMKGIVTRYETLYTELAGTTSS